MGACLLAGVLAREAGAGTHGGRSGSPVAGKAAVQPCRRPARCGLAMGMLHSLHYVHLPGSTRHQFRAPAPSPTATAMPAHPHL